MQLGPSELILNADNSIFHLNLHPEDIADTIITVGDPDRVAQVSKYFDSIEVKKAKREFHTHTGVINGKRLSVISTGIGTDNIDIVLNELDALANINFKTREVNKTHRPLEFIRIGTSGAIQAEIPLDSFIISEYAIGFDGLLHYYKSDSIQEHVLNNAFVEHTHWSKPFTMPYTVACDHELSKKLNSNHIRFGITATNTGFYGPQGRSLRVELSNAEILSKISSFSHEGRKITNLEMETSGIYGLSKLLGHKAISMNCILANRKTGEFSKNPKTSVEKLIQYTLDKLTL